MFSSITARNVQDAYVQGLALVREHGVREETRNGPALVVPWPVMTVYERPVERVLLDPTRDANPFFHALEAMWMLAGRNDVASIDPFLGALKKYSDDGEIYHGAYGHRWRAHFEFDQLARIIELLRASPGDRRIVLQMWDATWDLGRRGLDFPCNTQIYFRTRHDTDRSGPPMVERTVGGHDISVYGGSERSVTCLDMTICNRSNDAVFGAYGANAVHMSVLQEFVAAACGLQVGHMYQMSNNLHGYMETLDRVGVPEVYNYYADNMLKATPLFRSWANLEVPEIMRQIEAFWENTPSTDLSFFTGDGIETLELVRQSYLAHKNKDRDSATSLARSIPGDDWGRACSEWLERRYNPTP